jgi:hypothetical protein
MEATGRKTNATPKVREEKRAGEVGRRVFRSLSIKSIRSIRGTAAAPFPASLLDGRFRRFAGVFGLEGFLFELDVES